MKSNVKAQIMDILTDEEIVKQLRVIFGNGISQIDIESEQSDAGLKGVEEKRYRKLIDKCSKLEKDCDNYNKQIQELEMDNIKLNKYKDEYGKLVRKLKDMEREFNAIIQEKDNVIREQNEKYIYFQNNYSALDVIFQKYIGLGSEIHADLQRVLNKTAKPSETAEILVSYGIQEINITALWELMAVSMKKYKMIQKYDDLLDIFNYFFSLYKKISLKEVEYIVPKIGEEFDERYHTRSLESSVSGEITEVLLPGYRIGLNTFKKPIVKI